MQGAPHTLQSESPRDSTCITTSPPATLLASPLSAPLCCSLWTLWKQCGDTRTIADHYPALTNYMNFMQAQVDQTGLKNLYSHYGDCEYGLRTCCPPVLAYRPS